MTKQQIQNKLNRLAKISSELDREAKRRYGPDGNLFYESEGTFFLLDGDSTGGSDDRQSHIKMRSEGYTNMGCGAW